MFVLSRIAWRPFSFADDSTFIDFMILCVSVLWLPMPLV